MSIEERGSHRSPPHKVECEIEFTRYKVEDGELVAYQYVEPDNLLADWVTLLQIPLVGDATPEKAWKREVDRLKKALRHAESQLPRKGKK